MPRYRWRAAAYGVRVRFAQPAFELVRLALVVMGLVVAVGFGIGKAPPHIAPVGGGAIAFAVAITVLLGARYLGNLSRIMDIAAWSEEGATRISRDMALGMRNDDVYGLLVELYRPIIEAINRDLRRRGVVQHRFALVEMAADKYRTERYAAVALPASDTDSLETLLGTIETGHKSWMPQRFRNLADSRQRLMRKWRSIDDPSRAMEDERGDNYCMSELVIESDRALCLRTGVATYGEIVRSCDALINELALYAYLTGSQPKRWRLSPFGRGPLRLSAAQMLRRLPWRNRIHRECRARPVDFLCRRVLRRDDTKATSLFMRPRDRAAGLGIAVATLDRRRGESERVYLGIRSSKVGTYPATSHVVPAGMCNTYGTHFTAQWSGEPPEAGYLRTAMRCEFLEEWFGEKELENNRRRNWSERVQAKWGALAFPADGLRGRVPLVGGQSSPVKEDLRLTGIAFDLLNLRPEVCATAVVDTSEGELNWEFDEIGVEGPLSAMGRIDRVGIVQSGAAALMLAQIARGQPAGARTR